MRYALPAGACGIPATLDLYPDRVRIVTTGARFEASHPRFPKVGNTSYLPGQRAEQLAAVAGARKRLHFMRERLFALLEELGQERFLRLLQRALLQRLIGGEYVVGLAAKEVASWPLDDLDAMLKRLHMPTIRRLYPDLAIRAEEEGMSYRTFLELLCAKKIAHRAQTRITRSVRKANSPSSAPSRNSTSPSRPASRSR